MSSKRKHTTLCLDVKAQIVKELKSGISGKKLALKYGVGTSTISDIRRKQGQIESFVNSCDSWSSRRQTLRNGTHPEMERQLYSWYLSEIDKNAQITNKILAEKAKLLYKKCYRNDNFRASSGWITKFKQRHGIRVQKSNGDETSPAHDCTEPPRDRLLARITQLNLSQSQIYHANESSLLWKTLPQNVFARSNEKPTRHDESFKERLTFLTCCNSDGSHKLKLLVVGTAQNPRSFRNVPELPVDYESTTSATITSSLFAEWFRNSFVEQVGSFARDNNLPAKALLLVHDAAYHSDDLVSDDGQFVTIFVPTKFQASIQLVTQRQRNAIRLTKLFYRKHLLMHILSSEAKGIGQCIKGIDLMDAVCYLAEAWTKVSASDLKSSCNNLQINAGEIGDDLPSALTRKHTDSAKDELKGIFTMLTEICTDAVNDNEINRWVEDDEVSQCENERDADIGEDYSRERKTAINKVSHTMVIDAFNTCLQWAEENDVPLNQANVLRNLKEKAVKLKGGELTEKIKSH